MVTTLNDRTREHAKAQNTSRISNDGRLPGRRRSVPHLAIGALLVVACTAGFAVTAARVDHRSTVLALAKPVTVGQVLTGSDVRQVKVAVDTAVDTIDASATASVVGQRVSTSLPAGALLTRAELSDGVPLDAGQAVVAVLAKSGAFPPGLAAGARVLLVSVPVSSSLGATSTGAAGSSASQWSGTVIAVQALANDQGSVVSVQLPVDQASVVAALPSGGVDLVLAGGA